MKNTAFRNLRWIPVTSQDVLPMEVTLAAVPGEAVARPSPLRASILRVGLPEPPQDLPVAQKAAFLLNAVAEVEHALLAQYLYAAYSIRVKGNPNPAVARKRRELIRIATEEMGHLITAQNLLLALGAPPYFNRDDTTFGGEPAGDFPFLETLEQSDNSLLSAL